MMKNLLKKVLLSLLVVVFSNYSINAQFATNGVGRYKEQIFWLNWDKSSSSVGLTEWPSAYASPVGRLDGAQLVEGQYIWTINPGKIRVVGSISNLSASPVASANINVGPGQGGTGNYSAGFLNMYGGISGSIGIKNQVNGALVGLTVGLSLQIYNGAEWVDVDSLGIVIADSESITSDNAESIQGTVTSNANAWELIDYNIGTLASETSTYNVSISNTANSRVFKATNTANNRSTGDMQESVVMLARGARSVDLAMKGNGLQIASFGFMMPFDYGDLLQSYGESAHYVPLFDNNGTVNVLANGTYLPKNTAIANNTSNGNIVLGTTIDAEQSYAFSTNATGDDTNGIDDEDGITNEVLNGISLIQRNIAVITNNGNGNAASLHAWIDMDQSGTFEASEKMTFDNNIVPAGSINLIRNLILPSTIKAGKSYALRVRIGSGTAHQTIELTARDGEVEDYIIFIQGYSITGNVVHDINGVTDGVSGSALGSPDGATLYAYLVDSSGTIVDKVTVNSTTGSYTFEDASLGSYTVNISNNATLVIGDKPTVTTFTLPEGWSNSAQRDADNQVNTKGYTALTITDGDDITVAKSTTHGLNKAPVTIPSSYTLNTQPTSGQVIPLNNTVPAQGGQNLDVIAFNDPDGGNTPLTVTITELPSTDGDNALGNIPELLYNNVPVTLGQVIPDFDPSLLAIRVNGVGYTQVSFKYTVTDAAGAESNESTYAFGWSTALPISLVSFQVTINAEGQVVLTWATASEENSAYFEVERSAAQGWVTIGNIAAAAYSDTVKEYTFSDKAATAGTNLFRLKMVDLDGTFSYSKIQSVFVKMNARFYPNPTKDFIQIDVEDWKNVREVAILNAVGYTVYSSNQPEQVISVTGLAEGVYFINVKSENGAITTGKFVVIK